MVSLSLVIITYNEESNLHRCLSSASPLVDEIIVIDSGSTDQTVEIANSFGAKVVQRPFIGFRDQKQFAVDQASHDYILALDADEVIPPQLAASIQAVRKNWTMPAYSFSRLHFYGNQPIHYGGWNPNRIVRLFDRRVCAYGEASIHEYIEVPSDQSVGYLEGKLTHYAYRDVTQLLDKQNRYSSQAAEELHQKGKSGSLGRILVKPAFRWLKEYLFRLGFLDGFNGFLIAWASAQYVFLREVKLRELTKVG